MTVAERIKEMIKEEGLVQYKVGLRAGLTKKEFNDLLNGRKKFDVEYIEPICKALRKSPSEVLGYKEE